MVGGGGGRVADSYQGVGGGTGVGIMSKFFLLVLLSFVLSHPLSLFLSD